jgi:Chitinase class I
MNFDRKIYFDHVREELFDGAMSQSQVDGQEAILTGWEERRSGDDIRWLANFLAQSAHETGFKMQPVEEIGGADQPYGQPDPETGQCYYGRGFIQITHKENYERADNEVGCDSVAHPEQQLEALISGATGYRGMQEGWFRSDSHGKQTFARYFNAKTDDPYGAREIVNGDKKTVPDWSNGVSIGNLIAGYHRSFLAALEASLLEIDPGPEPMSDLIVDIPLGVPFTIRVDGQIVLQGGDDD